MIDVIVILLLLYSMYLYIIEHGKWRHMEWCLGRRSEFSCPLYHSNAEMRVFYRYSRQFHCQLNERMYHFLLWKNTLSLFMYQQLHPKFFVVPHPNSKIRTCIFCTCDVMLVTFFSPIHGNSLCHIA